MSRRIDIELTSSRDDGSWTWRAAGAREPRGTLDGAVLPSGAQVGDVFRVEIDGYLDGVSVVGVVPPRAARPEPERLELRSAVGGGDADRPLVTTTLARKRPGERSPARRGPAVEGTATRERGDRDRPRREGRRPARDRQEARHERPARPAPPPPEVKPKHKRLRPGKAHRTALLDAVPVEQRPIAEQLLQGGIPAVRQAIDKQNESLRAEGKTEVKADQLLRVAEELRPRAAAAAWRDRAEAAVAAVDELDLRDLRSVVNAAGDAGRDDEARALAAQLREALTNRVEREHAAWLAELAETLHAGRIVRTLRLSSRPPKAGAPIPADLANQLVEATSAALTSETGQERWAAVLDALAYSPIRRRVVPQSLPAKLSPELRATVARLGTRLPEMAHIFAIEPVEPGERSGRGGQARRRAGAKPGEPARQPRGARGRKPRPAVTKPADGGTDAPPGAAAPEAESQAPATPRPDASEAAAVVPATDAPVGTGQNGMIGRPSRGATVDAESRQ
jgi:hypothetical protein